MPRNKTQEAHAEIAIPTQSSFRRAHLNFRVIFQTKLRNDCSAFRIVEHQFRKGEGL
jgi:hypothetical protein